MNVILTGFMGTGKTAVGKRLARRLGWRFIDIDRLIEATAKKPVPKIFTEHGERVFRRLEQRMIRRVARGHEQVISTGGGAFADVENRRLLRAVGPTICLTATPKVILQRVSPTLARRPMLAAASPLARIQQLMQQRAAAYAQADLTIDTSHCSIEEVVERIWAEIGPWVSKSWQYLLRNSEQLSQRYRGRYIVVLDDRIVAVGATQLEAYQRVRKPVPSRCELGIYYIPLPDESAVALRWARVDSRHGVSMTPR